MTRDDTMAQSIFTTARPVWTSQTSEFGRIKPSTQLSVFDGDLNTVLQSSPWPFMAISMVERVDAKKNTALLQEKKIQGPSPITQQEAARLHSLLC